jgi:hypothetical protein
MNINTREYKWCCLGVLAHIQDKLTKPENQGNRVHKGLKATYSDSNSYTNLSDTESGLSPKEKAFLMGLNDDLKLNFYQIAHIIEDLHVNNIMFTDLSKNNLSEWVKRLQSRDYPQGATYLAKEITINE